jgi:hypothetical protein
MTSVVVLTLGVLIRAGIISLRARYEDSRFFATATQSTSLSREVIGRDFQGFKTAEYRIRYVNWLKRVPSAPIGEWRSGRPNVDDDLATALLAQIDEKWLGLDA